MKPKEKKPEIVYRIIGRESGNVIGSYSRACCEEYDFNSISEARNANCRGIFQDGERYKITKYRVTYELIEDDCDKDNLPKYDPFHLDDQEALLEMLKGIEND